MRRILIILAAAAALAGCKIHNGYDFEPTEMGYRLSQYAHKEMSGEMGKILTMIHFREYLAAGDEKERTAIHDLYFYSERIVEREENLWQIIGRNEESIIYTGGNMLDRDGDQWRIAIGHGNNEEEIRDYSLLTRFAGDDQFGYISSQPDKEDDRAAYFEAVFRAVREETITGDEANVYRFDITEGHGRGNYDFEYDVIPTLQYNTRQNNFTGTIRMSKYVDGVCYYPEAKFMGNSGVVIRGGKDNRYEHAYNGYNYHYWE